MERDAKADLELHAKTSYGPWFVNPRSGWICHGDPTDDRENSPIDDPADDDFIVMAWEALPYWIHRATQLKRERDEAVEYKTLQLERDVRDPPPLREFADTLHGLIQKAIADAMTPEIQRRLTTFPLKELTRNELLRKAADNVIGALHFHKERAVRKITDDSPDEESLNYVAYLLWSAAADPKRDRSDYLVLAKAQLIRQRAMGAIGQCFY